MADFGLDTAENRQIYDEMQVDKTVTGLTYYGFLKSQAVQEIARRKQGYESRRYQLRHINVN